MRATGNIPRARNCHCKKTREPFNFDTAPRKRVPYCQVITGGDYVRRRRWLRDGLSSRLRKGAHMSDIQTGRPRRLSDETKGNLAIVLTAIAIAVTSTLALWVVQ